jgi:hypothetical protein
MDTEANTPIMFRAGEDIGVKDKNGNDIFVGAVIEHNGNLYLIKWSTLQKEFVARMEPTYGNRKNWQEYAWIKNLGEKYIEIVGTILFDEAMRARFAVVFK